MRSDDLATRGTRHYLYFETQRAVFFRIGNQLTSQECPGHGRLKEPDDYERYKRGDIKHSERGNRASQRTQQRLSRSVEKAHESIRVRNHHPRKNNPCENQEHVHCQKAIKEMSNELR